MDRDLRLVWLYCVIDEAVRSIIGIGRTRSRGAEPELTDVEVLTLQLWGEMEGLQSDASIWRNSVDRWIDWFPNIGSEWNFVRRCANLRSLMDRTLCCCLARPVIGTRSTGCRFRSADLPEPGVTNGSRAKRHGPSVRRKMSIITGSRRACR